MRSSLIPLLLWTTAAQAVPAQFTHQGRLIDADGVPLEDEVTLTFRVLTADSGGDTLWEDTLTLPIENGFYSAILGADEDDNPLDVEVLSEAPVWLEIQVDGEAAMFPRSPIQSVPYAAMAQVAEEVSGGPVDATEVAIDGGVVINEAGEWVGPAPSVSWSDLTDIPADFADGVDDDTDTDTDSFADLGTSCLDGNIPVWDAVVGAWGCGTDAVLTEDDVDAMVADNGYAMTSEVFSGSFSDLSDVPAYAMASEVFSGSFTDLSDVPDYAMASDVFSGSFDDLADVPDYAMASDVFSGSFDDLADVPDGLADGDDNTQLTEEEVDAYVSDNGYALAADAFSGSFEDLADVPAGLGQPKIIEPLPEAMTHQYSTYRYGMVLEWTQPTYQRFFSYEGGTYTRLQFRVQPGTSDDRVYYAIYSDEDGRPNDRLMNGQWTTDGEASLITRTVAITLEPYQDYHLFLNHNGDTRFASIENRSMTTWYQCDRHIGPPVTVDEDELCEWRDTKPFWFRLLP